MKVLVTGVGGMVGTALCHRLAHDGIAVRALIRPTNGLHFSPPRHTEVVRGDLEDQESLRRAVQGCDRIYHVAGLVSYAPQDCDRLYRVNVQGTANLLDAARRSGVRRVVLTSSTAAVGISPGGRQVLDEDAPFLPSYRSVPYMDSKRTGEDLALACKDLEVVAVNPATIYGAGDRHMNTGRVFRSIFRRRLRLIPPGGTGVVSVQDCVEGHLLAMEHGRPGRRYILATSNHPYDELFPAIAACLGVTPPRIHIPSSLYPHADLVARAAALLARWVPCTRSSSHFIKLAFSERYFSAARARSELGWRPTQSLPEMLAEAASFYLDAQLL